MREEDVRAEKRRVYRKVAFFVISGIILFNHLIRFGVSRAGFFNPQRTIAWRGTAPERALSRIDGIRLGAGEKLYGLRAHCPQAIDRGCERTLFYTRVALGLD